MVRAATCTRRRPCRRSWPRLPAAIRRPWVVSSSTLVPVALVAACRAPRSMTRPSADCTAETDTSVVRGVTASAICSSGTSRARPPGSPLLLTQCDRRPISATRTVRRSLKPIFGCLRCKRGGSWASGPARIPATRCRTPPDRPGSTPGARCCRRPARRAPAVWPRRWRTQRGSMRRPAASRAKWCCSVGSVILTIHRSKTMKN